MIDIQNEQYDKIRQTNRAIRKTARKLIRMLDTYAWLVALRTEDELIDYYKSMLQEIVELGERKIEDEG